MAGMQFEYDEKGGTFYYFLLSFAALVLIPSTYYFWPRKEDKEEKSKDKKQCHCEPCQMKKQTLKAAQPWNGFRKKIVKLGLIIGWLIFALLAYKVSTLELDFKEYDPFAELEIDRGASVGEIKKAYRKLSLIYHPDRETGDHKRFMRIAKAYAALTDDESRENWEKYGNPDGPGATHFGIALPKWIIEKQNSVWVLAAYGLVFMIILPVVVGTWWYRSIKFSGDQILLDTTQIFFYFFQKTPNMVLKRVIMVLAGAMEFEKSHNPEIVERPSDNEEIPALMKELPHLNEKNKEKPLCYPYSVKARALLHSHFTRLELPPKTLELDRQYMLKKCTYLVNEMVTTVAQLVALAHAGRVNHMPRLETIENCMKLSQMVVQALWDNKSPLLQLPHIKEDMLRHFVTKRRNIRTLQQFANMTEENRRSLLRTFTDDEYRDIMNVVAAMPSVTMSIKSEVLDDEDSSITAGSIVTVTVTLTRENMDVMFDNENFEENQGVEEVPAEQNVEEEKEETADSPARKPKVWEKQKKKKGKQAKKKFLPKQPIQRKNAAPSSPVANSVSKKEEAEAEAESEPNTPKRSKKQKEHNSDNDDDSDNADMDSDSEGSSRGDGEEGGFDDEDDWAKFQEESKKENSLETKSKETHSVHCPYFPLDKQEWWWVYIADRKHHMLITAPVQICSLKKEEEVQLKFSAPPKPGSYQYTVILRSDSYLDFDQYQNIKLDVKEAKKVESHPQWETISEDEDEKDAEGSESDVTSESDYDEDDDE